MGGREGKPRDINETCEYRSRPDSRSKGDFRVILGNEKGGPEWGRGFFLGKRRRQRAMGGRRRRQLSIFIGQENCRYTSIGFGDDPKLEHRFGVIDGKQAESLL